MNLKMNLGNILKKFVEIAGFRMDHTTAALHRGHAITALAQRAKWIGRMGRELFLLERENINRRIKKMVETVGELIDWLLAFEMDQEIVMEKIEVLPHKAGESELHGDPELAGEYYQKNGFLERGINPKYRIGS
jgi:hypothetical protein